MSCGYTLLFVVLHFIYYKFTFTTSIDTNDRKYLEFAGITFNMYWITNLYRKIRIVTLNILVIICVQIQNITAKLMLLLWKAPTIIVYLLYKFICIISNTCISLGWLCKMLFLVILQPTRTGHTNMWED